MSKLFTLTFFALAVTLSTQAQEYRLFKVDLSSGYSRPSTPGLKAGFNLSLEPKFNIANHLAIGIKAEGVLLAAVSNTTTGDGTVSVLRSFSVTGEYYFGKKLVRPYLGIGAGFYKGFSLSSDSEDLDDLIISENQLGITPRAGLQIGHFRLGAEYNFVKDFNFFSVKIGTTIGGGRK
jgi:outer membrane protein X